MIKVLLFLKHTSFAKSLEQVYDLNFYMYNCYIVVTDKT